MRKKYSKVIQPYVDHLNRVLNKTITASRLDTLESEAAFVLVTRFQNDDILPLELSGGRWLHFRQQVVEQGGRVEVHEVRYIFSLSPGVDDEEHHVFRWEYIRVPPASHVPQSHLHVYGTNSNVGSLSHIHFPTRRLSIEQVIAHLIDEHNIIPRSSNWRAILNRGLRDFLRRTLGSEVALSPFP